jgi:hypothetical protein
MSRQDDDLHCADVAPLVQQGLTRLLHVPADRVARDMGDDSLAQINGALGKRLISSAPDEA